MNTSARVARIRRKAVKSKAVRAEIATQAVGYIRVSTDEQAASGYGLAAQEDAIRSFAASQGYELIEVIEDAGVSGTSRPAERDGFRRIVDMVDAGQAAVVLVWRFDRLARSIIHALTAAQELTAAGADLRSVSEPIDTSNAMGKTLFAMLAGMAEAERAAITERTLAGKREKARRGGHPGGYAPLGYRLEKGRLEIDPDRAELVRRIFAMREAGATLQGIANTLRAEGIPTASGGQWWPATVRYVLENPIYRGRIEFFVRHGTEAYVQADGKHEPIIIQATV